MNIGCEMVAKGLCLGCTGLAEKDWAGKYSCSVYKEIKRRSNKDDKRDVKR